MVATPGRINGRDVTLDPRTTELAKLLNQHADFRPPRSRSLTPFHGEHPPTVKAISGGFIGTGHGGASLADEQPERIEAGR